VPEADLLTTHDDYSDFLYSYLSSGDMPLPQGPPRTRPSAQRRMGHRRPAIGAVIRPVAAALNRVLGVARQVPLTRPLCDKLALHMVRSAMPQMVERVTGSAGGQVRLHGEGGTSGGVVQVIRCPAS
jgi:hypothetical protein